MLAHGLKKKNLEEVHKKLKGFIFYYYNIKCECLYNSIPLVTITSQTKVSVPNSLL